MNSELLIKYIVGDCTEQEKITIINWLDSDPKNMKEFLSLRKLYDFTIWQTSPSIQNAQKPVQKIRNWFGKHHYIQVVKIAAVFLIAVFISRLLFPEPKNENQVVMQTIHVPAGQRAEITLVDGTKVWLNAKTTFTFPNYFSDSSRNVTIDGEGFFDVSSDKLKPFIVETENYNVKVLGTKFNLMAYSDKEIFETSLLEGSVEVLKSGYSKGILIKPNERIFLKNGRMIITPITHMNHFLWKDGIISFNDESFPEMVKKLELYFDLKIEIKNENILKYRCTGKFRTKDGIEHILKVLQLSNKFSYYIDEKLNTITIK